MSSGWPRFNARIAPVPVLAPRDDINPEGFFTPEDRDEIMLLSDDGNVEIDGVECKRLRDARKKRFRGVWVALPSATRPTGRR